MSSEWQSGSTRAYRTVRSAVLARDQAAGWRCRTHDEGWCARSGRTAGHVCTGRTGRLHVHHTRGRAITGDDPAHMVAGCASCNLFIGDPTRGNDPPCTPITRWT